MDRTGPDPPDPLSSCLLVLSRRSGGAEDSGRSGAVPTRHFLTLLTYLRPISPMHRRAASIRLSPAGNASFILPRGELHRLLAPHQHLLEGFHDEAGVLPQLFPVAALG